MRYEGWRIDSESFGIDSPRSGYVSEGRGIEPAWFRIDSGTGGTQALLCGIDPLPERIDSVELGSDDVHWRNDAHKRSVHRFS